MKTFCTLLALLALVTKAHSANFVVTNSNATGAGSFAQAVANANSAAGADTITFDTAAHFSVARTITVTGQINVTSDVTIDAPTSVGQRVTLSGNNANRILQVSSGGALEIQHLTFTNGLPPNSSGGAIRLLDSASTLDLTDCIFTANDATSGAAAVLIFDGSATMTNCSFTLNEGGQQGSALEVDHGNLTLTRCKFTENAGRGVACYDSTVAITNCEISNNNDIGLIGTDTTATIYGSTFAGNNWNGVHLQRGDTTLSNCTISGNAGTGVLGITSTVELQFCTITGNDFGIKSTGYPGQVVANTIIAGNTNDVASEGIGAEANTLGNNLIGVASEESGFTFGYFDDLVGSVEHPLDPMLQPLADNGGFTKTHALRVGSMAVDGGDAFFVSSTYLPGPPFNDQRASPRIAGPAPDIGAYEQASLQVTTTANNGAGSLRDVIAESISIGGGVITFQESVFGTTQQTITLTGGQIPITESIDLRGPDIGVRISGNQNSRIFNITSGSSTLRRVQVINGDSTADGGGIRVAGNGTSVVLRDVTVGNCSAAGLGGGIFTVNASTLSMMDCAVVECNATGSGGGIYISGASTLNLTNSTISGNDSSQSGGGVGSAGTTTIINSTIVDNTADKDNAAPIGDGGGIKADGGTFSLGNTLVASNFDASTAQKIPDAAGSFVSLGTNLISKNDGASGFVNGTSGDIVGTSAAPINAQFDTLQYLPATSLTRVHPILPTSPAVNAGSAALLDHAAWQATPEFDQRGQFRTYGGNVDIGAVEQPNGTIVKMKALAGSASEHGLRTAKFRIKRSFPNGGLAITFNNHASSTASTADYTLSGPGYQPIPQAAAFSNNDDSITLTLTPLADTLVEGTETLALTLTGLGYATDPGEPPFVSVDIFDDEFTVTNSADGGAGSLRAAIDNANLAGGGKITLPSPLCIPLTGGPLTINSETEIIGNASTIMGNGTGRVIEILGDGGGAVKLQGLTIMGGRAATLGHGGGIFSVAGELELRGCSLSHNAAEGDGGAIYQSNGLLTIVNSSINDNTANNGGGVSCFGRLAFTNVTIARNRAINNAGGVRLANVLGTLINCTITENVADSDNNGTGDGGAAYWALDNTMAIHNSVISGNFDTPKNAGPGDIHRDLSCIDAIVDSGGGNFIGHRNGTNNQLPLGEPNANGDYVGGSGPGLDAQLTARPGLKLFYTYPPGSPLANNGMNAIVTEPNDIRGRPRIANTTVDIGAVEISPHLVSNASNTGANSLRTRIANAVAAGGGDVVFDPTFFATPRTISLTSGEIPITGSVTIFGPPSGENLLTVDAGALSRVFNISPASSSDISIWNIGISDGSTLQNAVGNRLGGGILLNANASLKLTRVMVSQCYSTEDGGGIYVPLGGRLEVVESTLFANNALNFGGGIANAGDLKIDRSLLRSNSAEVNGGGVANIGSAEFLSSTFITNSAMGAGGGAFHASLGADQLKVESCTFKRNFANRENTTSGLGGGLRRFSGTVTIRNSAFADNFNQVAASLPDNISGTVTSLGNNFLSSATGAVGITNGVNGDLAGTVTTPLDGRVDELGSNGGPTQTCRLLTSSPLLDMGSSNSCTYFDQRGLPGKSGSSRDIGAYELQEVTYDYWASYTFPEGAAKTGTLDDFDQDGASNLIEYFDGSVATDVTSKPQISVQKFSNGIYFNYRRSPLAPASIGLSYFSSDLSSWSAALPGETVLDGNYDGYLMRASRIANSATKMFGRLRVTLP